MKVGFIGTGHMGNPMARNFLKNGTELVVHDLNPEACANLLELGASWADSPRDLASQCSVVFTSLPGPRQVDEVALSEDGIFAGAAAGTIHVDLSSNSITAVRRLAAMAAQRNLGFLDAPVSGGTRGAEAATLAIMVGGDKSSFDAVLPLFEQIGKNIFHLGDVGAGSILKLTNNLLGLGSQLLLEEVLTLGVKAGITPETMFKVWSTASSAPQAAYIPRVLKRDWDDPFFSLELSAKDIGLCLEAARDLQVPMGVGNAIGQTFTRALVRGYGNKHWFATLKVIEEDAGVDVGTWVEEEQPAT